MKKKLTLGDFVENPDNPQAECLERKITLKKPPQNWGTFEFVRTADKGGIDDGGDGGSGESLGGVL